MSNNSRKIAKASGIVGITTIVSRVLGLVRDRIIALYFGAGFETDAFFVAFKIPNLLRRFVAEGSLATAFVPIFVDEKEKSEQDAKDALAAATSFSLILTSVLTVLGVVFAQEIASFFAPGFTANQEKIELAANLTQIMFPYIILVSLLALMSGALNALGVFALPALAPAILNICIIASILYFTTAFEQPIYSIAWAVIVGGFITLIPQMIILSKRGYPTRLKTPWRSQAVKKLFTLMIPSVFSASLYQLMVFINTVFASLLVEQSVSWLFYADRLFQFPLGVFTIAIATALLPSLSEKASRKEFKALSHQLSRALCWVAYITIPATAGLICLANPLTAAIYQGGKFSASDTLNTANALVAFCVGLWAISSQSIVVRGFLAQKNTLVPSIITGISILLNIVLAVGLMGPAVQNTDGAFLGLISYLQQKLEFAQMSHVGLALAGSVTSMASLIVMTSQLKRVNIQLDFKMIAHSIARALVASIFMGTIVYKVADNISHSLLTLLICVPLGGIVYFICSTIIGSSEAKEVLDLVKERKK